MNPGAIDFKRGLSLLEHVEREVAADQRVAGLFGQFAIGVVDEGDAAFCVTQNDQVALRFEQAAGALLGLLQFPVPIGQRLVVQGDLAELLAHPAQPEAQRRQRDASDREQEAGADRERVGVITGIVRPAAGDESIRAAKRGGEDYEGADGEGEPVMASREATNA